MTFENLDGTQLAALADEMAALARDLDNALAAARNMRDRAASAANLGLRPGDAEYLAAADKDLRAALNTATAEEAAPEPQKTVPLNWWEAIRSDLDTQVLRGEQADGVSFSLGAAAVRNVKSTAKHAQYVLAQMDQLEGHRTLAAALDAGDI